MDKEKEILVGFILDEKTLFNLAQLKQTYDARIIIELVEQGVIVPEVKQGEQLVDLSTLRRIEKAIRLHEDLEINLSGIALILDLIDEMEKIKRELNYIKVRNKLR